MREWIGKLYVFWDERDGCEYISVVNPLTHGVDPLRFRGYQVQGPFVPIAGSKALAVHDAQQWLNELKNQGFKCEPCSIG